MSTDTDRLQKHVQAVLNIQNQNESQPLSLEELKEISISLGITENDWLDLMQKAKDNIQTAKEHLKHENFSDALVLAKEAIALNPYIESGHSTVAKSHLMLAIHDNDEYQLDDAEKYAKEALRLDPKDSIAFDVLGSLRSKTRTRSKAEKSFKSKILIPTVLITCIGLIAIAGVNVYQGSVIEEETRNKIITLEQQVASANAQVMNVKERKRELFSNIISMSRELDLNESGLESLAAFKSAVDNNGDVNASLTQLVEAGSLAQIEKFNTIIVQIEGAENRISVEKKRYNDLVAEYNALVKINPDIIPDLQEMDFLE